MLYWFVFGFIILSQVSCKQAAICTERLESYFGQECNLIECRENEAVIYRALTYDVDKVLFIEYYYPNGQLEAINFNKMDGSMMYLEELDQDGKVLARESDWGFIVIGECDLLVGDTLKLEILFPTTAHVSVSAKINRADGQKIQFHRSETWLLSVSLPMIQAGRFSVNYSVRVEDKLFNIFEVVEDVFLVNVKATEPDLNDN